MKPAGQPSGCYLLDDALYEGTHTAWTVMWPSYWGPQTWNWEKKKPNHSKWYISFDSYSTTWESLGASVYIAAELSKQKRSSLAPPFSLNWHKWASCLICEDVCGC